MTIWTVEIDNEPIFLMWAETRDEAEDAIAPDGPIATDLTVLERPDGGSIWNGETALVLREAAGQEHAAWEEMIASAVLAGEIGGREEAQEEGFVAFLVPVVDPQDDDLD